MIGGERFVLYPTNQDAESLIKVERENLLSTALARKATILHDGKIEFDFGSSSYCIGLSSNTFVIKQDPCKF